MSNIFAEIEIGENQPLSPSLHPAHVDGAPQPSVVAVELAPPPAQPPAPAPLPDVAVFPPTPDDIGDILEAFFS